MGDKMDTKGAHALKPGGYHYLPAKAHHYAPIAGISRARISGHRSVAGSVFWSAFARVTTWLQEWEDKSSHSLAKALVT